MKKLPTLGFIGTGAITKALVTGLCSRAADVPYPIVISPRNAKNAAQLKADYPDQITIAENNQAIVDTADWVILAVHPNIGEDVCRSLRFRPDHKVINLMFDKSIGQIRDFIGEVDTILFMIPLTFNAFTDGPIVLYPANDEAAAIFGHIGRIIFADDPDQALVYDTFSGCVTSLFAVMDSLIHWSESKGLSSDDAATYITRFFNAVSLEASGLDRSGIHTMATVSLENGINMQALNQIGHLGGFEAWQGAMENIYIRLASIRLE